MPSLLSRINSALTAARGGMRGRELAVRDEARFSIDQYVNDYLRPAFTYNGVNYLAGGGSYSQQRLGDTVAEITNTLPAYAAALRSAPPAFAAEMVRALILSQARFTFRNRMNSSSPRRTFGTRALSVLESPDPSRKLTTAKMIGTMEWHAGVAGNAFVYRQAGRGPEGRPALRVLRPDWTAVIWGSQEEPERAATALDNELLGYVYWNGGYGTGRPWTMLPGEVAHWCVDEETEILTADGWRDYRTLQVGDEVLTLNHETGMSEWQPALDVMVFPKMRRDMILMEGNEFSSFTTLDHRWPVEYRIARAKTYGRRWVTTDTIGAGDRIPIAAHCADTPNEAKYQDALVEIVAWFYTEGRYKSAKKPGSKGRGIEIAQSTKNDANVARIRAALSALFGPAVDEIPRTGRRVDQPLCWRETVEARPGHDMVIFRLSANASDSITEFAPKKVVRTDFIRSLTAAQLELFIKVSLLADNTGPSRLGQKNPRMAEQFALACLLAGYGVSIRPGEEKKRGYLMTDVRMLRKRHTYPQEKNRAGSAFRITRTTHDGHVWCPRTENQTWLARRKGSVYFTGNCPIPDPENPGLGQSWLTPALREIQGDRAATDHKLMFFSNGATPSLLIKGIAGQNGQPLNKTQFDEIVDMMEARHSGSANAYKTLYLTGGADATVIGTDLKQVDFTSVQGRGENRVSYLSRVPASLLGISEGLQGSSLNAGNFDAARRNFADTWVYATLQDLAASLAAIVEVPADAELWPDVSDMPILREDSKDQAEIQQVQAAAIASLINSGYEPDSVVRCVQMFDLTQLKHTGLYSVQLQPPQNGQAPGSVGPDGLPVDDGSGATAEPSPADEAAAANAAAVDGETVPADEAGRDARLMDEARSAVDRHRRRPRRGGEGERRRRAAEGRDDAVHPGGMGMAHVGLSPQERADAYRAIASIGQQLAPAAAPSVTDEPVEPRRMTGQEWADVARAVTGATTRSEAPKPAPGPDNSAGAETAHVDAPGEARTAIDADLMAAAAAQARAVAEHVAEQRLADTAAAVVERPVPGAPEPPPGPSEDELRAAAEMQARAVEAARLAVHDEAVDAFREQEYDDAVEAERRAFDDKLYAIVGEQRRFDPSQPRDPHTGKWSDGGVSALIKSLKKVGGVGAWSMRGDDDAYMDWSTRNSDGTFGLEATGDNGETVGVGLTVDQVAELHQALTDSIAKRHEGPLNGAYIPTDDVDGPYFEWTGLEFDEAGRYADGQLEIGDGENVATFDLSEKDLTDWHTALTIWLLTQAGGDEARSASLLASMERVRGVHRTGQPAQRGRRARIRLDDDARALLGALTELAAECRERGIEVREWSAEMSKKHPRGPGGKFRTVLDRLKGALAEHKRKGGTGDPFAEFNRTQLQRVAKAQGIELARGEHEDSIKKKLLAHLDKDAKPDAKKPDAPEKKGAPEKKADEGPEFSAGQDRASRIRELLKAAEVMHGSDRAKWPAHAKRDVARLERELAKLEAEPAAKKAATARKTPRAQRLADKQEKAGMKAAGAGVREPSAASKARKERIEAQTNAALDALDAKDAAKARADSAASGQAAVESVPMSLSTSYDGAHIDSADPSWTSAQRAGTAQALESYQGGGYIGVNGGLRSGKLTGADAEAVEGIDRAMAASKLTRPIVVHRGGGRRGTFLPPDWRDRGDLTGAEWTDEAYTSTSPDAASADAFGESIAMRIVAPEGTGAVYLPTPGIGGSAMVDEDGEILLDRGLRFRVVADHGTAPGSKVRRLDVEVVGKGDGTAAPAAASAAAPKARTPRAPRTPRAAAKTGSGAASAKPSGYTGPLYEPPTSAKAQRDLAEYKELSSRLIASHDGTGEKLDLHDYIELQDRRDELEGGLRPADVRRAKQEAQIESQLPDFARASGTGLSGDELKAEMARRAKAAFAGKRVAVRTTPAGLAGILRDGRFRTQHETGRSEAEILDPGKRAELEEQWFGLDRKSDPAKRPVYGYVMLDGDRPAGELDDDALSSYGQIQVVLKDDVRARTTAMFGDSIDMSHLGLPTPVDDPSWESFTPATLGVYARPLATMDRDPASADFRSHTYAEATVHGGVTTSDIAEVVFPAQPSPQLQAQLDAAGVPWRVMAGGTR